MCTLKYLVVRWPDVWDPCQNTPAKLKSVWVWGGGGSGKYNYGKMFMVVEAEWVVHWRTVGTFFPPDSWVGLEILQQKLKKKIQPQIKKVNFKKH